MNDLSALGDSKVLNIRIEKFNKTKEKILDLISVKPRTISELRKSLNLNYRTIWEQVNQLNEWGYVNIQKNPKKAGQPVSVILNKEKLKQIKELNKVLEKFKAN